MIDSGAAAVARRASPTLAHAWEWLGLGYVGSLNLDGRSARINTEIGLRLESEHIARLLFTAYRIEKATGVYRVTLESDGRTHAWSVLDASRQEVKRDEEPDASVQPAPRSQIMISTSEREDTRAH